METKICPTAVSSVIRRPWPILLASTSIMSGPGVISRKKRAVKKVTGAEATDTEGVVQKTNGALPER